MLVLRCQAGDTAAFEQIAGRWQCRLVRHAMRLLRDHDAASEAVQEAWLAIVRGMHRLDDPARFAPWAYRILRNKCMDRLRQATRSRAREEELAVDTSDEHGESADVYVQERDHAAAIAAMRVAIRDLPVEQRTLLSLFYFENLAVSEVAEAMGIPPGTVKSRLFHLRARLRTMMGPATGKATDNDGGTR
jgi:RNA polymerase sigma factor (sigma-70 family)